MNSWGNKFDETREADLFSTLADCKIVFHSRISGYNHDLCYRDESLKRQKLKRNHFKR